MPNEIPVVFHNRLNYLYDFIIKELENEFEGLEKSKKKYKNISVTIKKRITKIDKDGNESVETISLHKK